MARVKSIPLGRPHQERAYKFIRNVLRQRRRHQGYAGGIVLADGVGSGKTYEALAAVATLLSQRQHRKALPRQRALRVLVAVPPRLLSKWEDELRLPEKFLKYLAGWDRRPLTRAVHETFRDIKVLRRTADLWDRRGHRHYGHDVLPGGLYLANWNLLWKDIRKATQLHRTPWDAIIVDEAHHVGDGLVRSRPHTVIRLPKTAVLLLTATPFQLNPGEMEDLLTGTFGGYGSEGRWQLAQRRASELYGDPNFKRYRRCLNRHFEHGDPEAAREGQALRRKVERLLGGRVLRNPRKKNRRYHLVDSGGNARVIRGDPFTFSDEQIRALLDDGGRIRLDSEAEAFYLEVRASLAHAAGDGKRAFVAGTLRQALSSYAQFRRTAFGRACGLRFPDDSRHPKLAAVADLVERLVRRELRQSASRGWAGKVLIFTTYVGADSKNSLPTVDAAHGTARAIQYALTKRIESLLAERASRLKDGKGLRISQHLEKILDRYGDRLTGPERASLRGSIRRFARRILPRVLLARTKALNEEGRHLAQALGAMREQDMRLAGLREEEVPEETVERAEDHRRALFDRLKDRYGTRKTVVRYDGAVDAEDRARRLRGFNSPFSPLVLIASSVGQEGIDLQTYCRHVIHYDLEWNPAKIEQREGRVDRLGRLATDPVNVYFLVCRGTYDERVLHVMVNRFRWHQVLFDGKRKLERDPAASSEAAARSREVARLALDLRPR